MNLTSTLRHPTADYRHRLGRVLAVFFCLAVLQVCVVRRATAACGDYVMVRGKHQAMGQQHLSDGSSASHGRQTPAPRCHGPHCQQQFPPPAAPRPFLGRFQTDRACLAIAAEAPQANDTWTIFESPIPPRSGALREIEHPPRCAP